MQVDSTPPLFEPTRSYRRRNIKASLTLKPIVRPKAPTSVAQQDGQNGNLKQSMKDYNLPEGQTSASPDPFVTRERSISFEKAYRVQTSLKPEKSIQALIANQQMARRNPSEFSYPVLNPSVPEPSAYQTLGFADTRARSTSVETTLKKLNTKRKPESAILDPKVEKSAQFNLNVSQVTYSNTIQYSNNSNNLVSIETRERSKTDYNRDSYSQSFTTTRQRSPSIENSPKKPVINAPVANKPWVSFKNPDFKQRIMTRLRVHLRSRTIEEKHQTIHTQGYSMKSQPDQDAKQSEESGSSKTKTFKIKKSFIVPEVTSNKEQDSEQLEQLDDDDDEKSRSLSPTLPPSKLGRPFNPRDLVFSPNVKEEVLKRHIWGIIQGVRYALKQVKPPPVSQLRPKQVAFKKLEGPLKKTLVLDLDETLITTRCNDELKEKSPFILDKETQTLKVRIRPYAEEFLREMSKEFEIIIFTAAEKKYAEVVLKLIDPNQSYVSALLHRDYCLKTRKGLFIKDLRILKNRELKDMVIVDNFTPSFSFQIDNGVPIITWEGDAKDQELKYLMEYLKKGKEYDDMRVYNKEKLRLAELLNVSAQKFAGF